MKAVTAPASSKERIAALLDAYRAAPPDADIEILMGRTEGGIPSICVCIEGGGEHPFLAIEAQAVAVAIEKVLPPEWFKGNIPALAAALRTAAAAAEAEYATKN
jgi:hypothetical protein